MRLLAFILVSIAFSPLFLLGTTIYLFRVLVVIARRGVDGTAYEPYTARLIMHDLGTRSDLVGRRLAPHLTVTAPPVWFLYSGPFRWAVRLTGYVPALFTFPPERPLKLTSVMAVRTEFFDRTLDEFHERVQQVVILGAGWDTRAYDERWSHVKFFEVDAPPTQREKRDALADAQVDPSHVTFVPVDFNETTWLAALIAAGFDRTLPTCVLREGVSMYLDESVILETLHAVAGFAPGSAIAFDYLPKELFTSKGIYGLLGKYMAFGIRIVYRTEFKLLFPGGSGARDEIEDILDRNGLALDDYELLAFRENYPVYGFVLATVR